MARHPGERMKRAASWVLVGNPHCRRVGFWQAALAKRNMAPARLVTYPALLTGKMALRDVLSPASLVRFESAAEDWETYKLLLHHGIEPARQEGYPLLEADAIDRLLQARGLMVQPRQAHLGFERLLRSLAHDLQACRAGTLNAPEEILLQYDKTATQTRLAQARIVIPPFMGEAAGYHAIRQRHRAAGRAMVKLRHGSGGAGCIALHWAQGKTRAIASVREVTLQGEKRLYCSKVPHRLDDETAIAILVDRLCQEKVHVEDWLAKARWQGCNFDVRVVTVGGEPRQALARVSASVFTNLNLGNRRGDPEVLFAKRESQWQAIRTTAAQTARLFPGSFTLGIDVLIQPCFERHAVLEVNAFGNLLPRLLDRGEDTYLAAVSAWQAMHAPHMHAPHMHAPQLSAGST